ADALALPEGNRPREPRGRRDEDTVAGDLLDAPGRGPEQEGLPRPGLVDHLLVELADATAASVPPARPGRIRDEEDAEEPAIGNRSRIRDGETPRAVAGADRPAGAGPDHP